MSNTNQIETSNLAKIHEMAIQEAIAENIEYNTLAFKPHMEFLLAHGYRSEPSQE